MALNDTLTDILQKNSKILVNVEEALPDIIVVTYTFDRKLFQGVLLDSTKRNLPFGVNKIHPAFTTPVESKSNDNDDKLYSVSQRFNYQEKPTAANKRPTKSQSRVRNNRMTVRLRPRQVLCSKCRGVCNENSENVDHSRKRKTTDNNSTTNNVPHHDFNTRSQAKEKKLNEMSLNSPPRPLFSDNQNNSPHKRAQDPVMCPTLIPKIPRLEPNDITSAMNGNKIKIIGNYIVKPSPPSCENDDPLAVAKDPLAFNNNDIQQLSSDNSSDQYYETSDTNDVQTRSNSSSNMSKIQKRSMVLRKKKSVGSMEDLWDESVFEEATGISSLDGGTRTLKISFGREGEGTVLKIPKIDTFESENKSDISITSSKNANEKAAKRALKKAKKEARRKILIGAGQSPVYNLSGASPRYNLTSPRYTIGSTSPRYTISTTESLIPRRHKHKVKHKKKHRDERKHKAVQEDPLFIPENDTAIKERCLKQKLSISLKRLTENSYSSKCTNKTSPTESCDGFEDSPPNFPPAPQPLIMHISAAESPAIGLDADGNRLEVGDVVWGKIHGFPWWPGKVLSITAGHCGVINSTTSSGCGVSSGSEPSSSVRPQAHVAWYGSSTSSLMPCDQLSPFLENFKSRYNKKKRGPYKEAIRQATCEARNEQPSSTTNNTVSTTTALVPLVSPPLASPREIDVVS